MRNRTKTRPWAALAVALLGAGCTHGRAESAVGTPTQKAPAAVASIPATPAAPPAATRPAAPPPRREPEVRAPAPPAASEPAPLPASDAWQESHAAGHTALVEERLDEAEAQFLAAVERAESEEGTELLLAETLQDLGRLYVTQGRWADAEQVAGRALLLLWTVLGPDHPDTVLLMENYAGVLRALGRNAEAEAMEENARILRSVAEERGAPIPAPEVSP